MITTIIIMIIITSMIPITHVFTILVIMLVSLTRINILIIPRERGI